MYSHQSILDQRSIWCLIHVGYFTFLGKFHKTFHKYLIWRSAGGTTHNPSNLRTRHLPRITGCSLQAVPEQLPRDEKRRSPWRVVLGWSFHFNATRCWFLTIWRLVIMQYCLIYVYIYVVFLILTFAKCSKFEDVWRLFHSRLYGYWILSRISPESSPCSSNQP